ncbi:GNAT family N-acetyltransferase [Bacillus sp. PK3_68]|uniref:GNAT family N-acetyltransferase n=1 Tax=Bacillus sp. PK3_68 TaxID=2027408 RepID=UPI000E7072B3|nr:GNAT family N-acetyltransferase [Bacillus sp. PK3_68]RJS61247.1 GNAT family N-acetyltransferase [Bacillus sp. PK3_68]
MSKSKLESEITVHNIGYEDIDEVVNLSQIVFGPRIAYRREQLESQLEIFPEGQTCIKYKEKIVGSCSSVIVNFDEYGVQHSFKEISDEGFIQNHNPNGINLYGIDVTVHPDYRQMKIGRRLYETRRNICRQFNLRSIMFGGRIPHYYKYADKMPVDKYVECVIQGSIYDPVLTFQLRNGFTVKTIMKNYIPEDEASLKYGILMEWLNDHYTPRN